MNPKSYQRLLRIVVILGLISVVALTVWTVIAYRNASIINYVAGELWGHEKMETDPLPGPAGWLFHQL